MQIIRIPPGGIMFEEGNVKFPATDNVADQAAVVYHWRRGNGSQITLEETVGDVVQFNCQRMGFHRKFCSESGPVNEAPLMIATKPRANNTDHTSICKTCGARI